MRKWLDLAPKNDPGIWLDVSNFWPTNRGSYEVCDIQDGGNPKTATGETLASENYAFTAGTPTGQRSYVIGTKIWQFSGGTLTDRTNAVSINAPYMAQFGTATICAMGNATATVSSTGGNFAALAGAPKGEIVVVQSNAALIFNTDASPDGWAASDVGDYTNWTTGESASAQIFATPGPITAAVPHGNDVIVFKSNAIYRMSYVGGAVKWTVQLIHKGAGVDSASLGASAKYMAVSTPHGVVFANTYNVTTGRVSIYLFDGINPPRLLNPLTTISGPPNKARFFYDPSEDRVGLHISVQAAGYYFYSFQADAWGKQAAQAVTAMSVHGDYFAIASAYGAYSTVLPQWRATLNTLTLYLPTDPLGNAVASAARETAFLQTALIGEANPEKITEFTRFTPLLRRRTNGTAVSAAPAVSLTVDYFRELHNTSASSTQSVTESSQKARFDFLGADNYARFKLTFTDTDAEVDDYIAASVPAGVN